MRTTLRRGVLAALTLSAAVLAAGSATAQVREVVLRQSFRPAERSEVTFESTHELAAKRIVNRIGDGEPSEFTATLSALGTSSVAFVEEVRAAGPEGATDARREYRSATASVAMRDAKAPVDAAPLSRVEFTSDLTGASVRQLRRKDGTFGRHYDGREARESLLGFVADPLDLRGLLPAAAVAVGAEWDVPLGALAGLLAPVGDLGWRAPEEAPDPQLVRSFQQGLGGNLHLGFDGVVTGRARAQLFEIGVAGQERRATVRVTFELTLVADHTALTRRRVLENEREQGIEILSATSTRTLAGTAELLWSVEGERPLGANVQADEGLALEIRVQPEEGEAATQTVELAGRCGATLRVGTAPVASAPAPRDDR